VLIEGDYEVSEFEMNDSDWIIFSDQIWIADCECLSENITTNNKIKNTISM